MCISKSQFKVDSPTLQGTPPGVPPQGGTLKVLPCHPTLDPRPEGGVPPDHPTLDLRRQRRWGAGDLGTQGGGGGDHLETVQSRCAVRAVRWRGPPRHLGAQSPRVGGRPMTVGGRRPSGGGAVKLFLVLVADIQCTFPPSKRGPEPCGGASVGGGRWN